MAFLSLYIHTYMHFGPVSSRVFPFLFSSTRWIDTFFMFYFYGNHAP